MYAMLLADVHKCIADMDAARSRSIGKRSNARTAAARRPAAGIGISK